ncbi:MAG: hypothetical protein GY866_00920, partial [Proteobacteria bacterium]|nr:hypothetical protein [Pseudomonadota bacterium]
EVMTGTKKIIKMVADGKISVEEGERLLKAVKETAAGRESTKREERRPKNYVKDIINYAEKAQTNNSIRGKIVIDIESSRGEKVKLNVPIKLANLAAHIIPKDKIEYIENEGFNIRDILNNLSDIIDDIDDDIVNIKSVSGDSVRIYVVKN